MISIIQSALWLSIIPFSLTVLIDICLGRPGADNYNSRAIFFGYSFYLAKLRLVKYGMWRELFNQMKDNLNHNQAIVRAVAKKSYKENIFSTGRQYFTWELGLGMCPVCTGVRISILFALLCVLKYNEAWLLVILIPCFSSLYYSLLNNLKK